MAVASNGLHTNGYSLVRMLMDRMPQIKLEKIQGQTFIEQIMKPHRPYYRAIKEILDLNGVHGMAHITGGGIEGNLCRIIPDGLSAEIDLAKIKPQPIFSYIQSVGNIGEDEMLSTFNCGAGLMIVVQKEQEELVRQRTGRYYDCYAAGRIVKGNKKVTFKNHLCFIQERAIS